MIKLACLCGNCTINFVCVISPSHSYIASSMWHLRSHVRYWLPCLSHQRVADGCWRQHMSRKKFEAPNFVFTLHEQKGERRNESWILKEKVTFVTIVDDYFVFASSDRQTPNTGVKCVYYIFVFLQISSLTSRSMLLYVFVVVYIVFVSFALTFRLK